MKLSNNTIKRFFKGALCFSEEKGYITPYRYSKAQLDYMADESYDYGWRFRAKFTGGIRIELKTDAQNISFDYKASDIHERSNTVDLYVNDVLVSVYHINDKLKGHIEFNNLPKKEKKITIFLPCESKLEIKNFTIDGSYKSIKDKGERVLVIGDSITQGAGPQISSSAYLNALTRKTNYTFLGQGVGGYRYEPRDLMKVDGFEPDKIIVFLGTNFYEAECLESFNYDYEKATNEFYKKLNELYPNKPILSITPLWRSRDMNIKRFLWCIDTIKKACEPYKNIIVADGFTLIPNVDDCFSDGVHPNTYGSELLANNLVKFMKDKKF